MKISLSVCLMFQPRMRSVYEPRVRSHVHVDDAAFFLYGIWCVSLITYLFYYNTAISRTSWRRVKRILFKKKKKKPNTWALVKLQKDNRVIIAAHIFCRCWTFRYLDAMKKNHKINKQFSVICYRDYGKWETRRSNERRSTSKGGVESRERVQIFLSLFLSIVAIVFCGRWMPMLSKHIAAEALDCTIRSSKNCVNDCSSWHKRSGECVVSPGDGKTWRVDNGRLCIVERCDGQEGRVARDPRWLQRQGNDGKEGAPAQAPPRKWRHKRPHGRNHLPAMCLRDGDGAARERKTTGRGRKERQRKTGASGGCKCPRDVSDRCAASRHPPPYYAT